MFLGGGVGGVKMMKARSPGLRNHYPVPTLAQNGHGRDNNFCARGEFSNSQYRCQELTQNIVIKEKNCRVSIIQH
jgi:hypothetical protein